MCCYRIAARPGTPPIARVEGATGDRSDASRLPDPPIQGPSTPHRGLLADQLHPADEEPHEYVRQEYVKELRRRIATHKRFKRLVDQSIDLSIEHSRLTMQMGETKAN